ncbi:MAG: polysaccharide biosynthesis tyrosine autokinase [Cyclobacteriaceae bacterium]
MSNEFQQNGNFESEKDFFESFDLERFWYVLKRSKYWIIGFILLVVSTSYLYVRYTKPLYKSDSVIKLEFQSEANVLGLANAVNTQEQSEISGEIELIRSKLFFSRVVDEADLGVSYHLYGRYLTDERYKNSPFVVSHKILNRSYYDFPFDVRIIDSNEFELIYSKGEVEMAQRYRFGEEIKTEDFNFLIEKTDFFSDDLTRIFYFTVNSRDALIDYLQENVEVIPENLNAKTIKVSFTDHSRFKARDLVNLIDTLYLDYTREVKNQALEQKISFLDGQIDKTESKLQEYENYFEKFTIDNRTTDLNDDLNRTIDQLARLDSARLDLKKRIKDVERLSNQLKANLTLSLNPISIGGLPVSLEESLEEYLTLIQDRELKLGSYNETSYIIQQVDSKLTKARINLTSLFTGYGKSLDDRLTLLESRRSALEVNLSSLPSMRTEFGKTNRVYTLEEEFMLSLQQSKIELEITRAGTVTDNVILSSASLPSDPIEPQKFLIIAAATVMAFVISIVFLLIKYLAHNKVAGIKELEKLVNVPVLGSVPKYTRNDLDHSALVVKSNSKSSLSEALRTMRTNMDFIDARNGSKLVSVTSTVPGEGKTFVAANLGAIIAMTNQKVCVVDIDMRKPKVHLAFGGVSSKDGMSTLITGKSNLKASIQKTEIENLHFVSAGPTPPNPSELLLQKEFEQLLEQLRKQFDVIILDTPPVGLVTDARLAMVKSDIQLYVVRADYSKRSFAKVVNDLKTSGQFSNITVVLNAISSTPGYGYGYGYGYNYGYYEEGDKKTSSSFVKSLF